MIRVHISTLKLFIVVWHHSIINCMQYWKGMYTVFVHSNTLYCTLHCTHDTRHTPTKLPSWLSLRKGVAAILSAGRLPLRWLGKTKPIDLFEFLEAVEAPISSGSGMVRLGEVSRVEPGGVTCWSNEVVQFSKESWTIERRCTEVLEGAGHRIYPNVKCLFIQGRIYTNEKRNPMEARIYNKKT